MPRSMTGFARQEAQHSWGSLACEIRSVNHRYLEPFLRMQETLRSLEPELREKLKGRLSRGKVEISFQLTLDTQQGEDLGVNEKLASALVESAKSVAAKLDNPAAINPMEILRWPGVIQTRETDVEEIHEAARKLFDKALDQLTANRQREGEELGNLIEQRLANISEHVTRVRAQVPELQTQLIEKLRARLQALKVEVDEDRFHQEVAYLSQKSDIAEELDRLDAHVSEVRHTLQQNEPIGRRLDFLMQELNREANTLSSKSTNSETTQIAVDLKVFIEQMREQVQNIE